MKFRSLALTASLLALSAGTAMADYSLTILHTNDFHARFEPISKYDSGCSAESNAEGKCFGGSARLVTAVAEARARTNNSILVSGGDQFQGTLYYTYYKGKLAAEMMNKLGYDGMTVGNHEFDDGPEVLAGFMAAVDFPVLMSNADVSREPLLAGKLAKSTVIERGGEKIGHMMQIYQNHDKVNFLAAIDKRYQCSLLLRLCQAWLLEVRILSPPLAEEFDRVIAQIHNVEPLAERTKNTRSKKLGGDITPHLVEYYHYYSHQNSSPQPFA